MIDGGLAMKVKEGAGPEGVTVTMAVADALPPGPVAV
jgi:hypothetical protein